MQYLVSLNPLPEIWLQGGLEVLFVLDGVLYIPRVDELSFLQLAELEVKIHEILLLGYVEFAVEALDLLIIKAYLRRLILHL